MWVWLLVSYVHIILNYSFMSRSFKCCDYDIGDHMPAPCEQVDKWLQKASDESENVTWMIANTKKWVLHLYTLVILTHYRCPECRAPIEKNGGCMHMSCKKNSGGCGFEFCWLCRGPWSEHGSATGGYYNCNKYDKSKVGHSAWSQT